MGNNQTTLQHRWYSQFSSLPAFCLRASWKKWQVSWSPEWRNMSPRGLPSTTPWSTITSRIPTYSVSVKTDPQFISKYSVSVKKDPQFMRNLFLEFQTWPNTQTSWRRHHRSLNRQDWDSSPAGITTLKWSLFLVNKCDFVTSFYGDKVSPHLLLFRLLCKLPGTEEDPNSREVPWHQDSQYWPLEPMKVGRTFSASCKKKWD